jgi:hypothetical protein
VEAAEEVRGCARRRQTTATRVFRVMAEMIAERGPDLPRGALSALEPRRRHPSHSTGFA